MAHHLLDLDAPLKKGTYGIWPPSSMILRGDEPDQRRLYTAIRKRMISGRRRGLQLLSRLMFPALNCAEYAHQVETARGSSPTVGTWLLAEGQT